jgi:hypothetical protein
MVTAAQLKKPILIATAGKEHKSTVSTNYASAEVIVWLGYKDSETGKPALVRECSYSQELPSRYYVGLNLQGYVDSDQKPERGLVVRDLAYRQVDVTADRADCMSKTQKK